MKRSQALQPLSRDHHVALTVAMKLKRATEADAEEAAREFMSFFRDDGSHHFRVEEEVLLPAAARYMDADDERIVRVLTDHVEIRRRAADLEAATSWDAGALNELGELLDGHVRHEERVLFPHIESVVPAEPLAKLAVAVQEAERRG